MSDEASRGAPHKNLPRKVVDHLFEGEAVFACGAADEKSLPSEAFPEIAFIGRSNVGKSSLVNALTGKKLLAHVSNTPGRTQQLNFFRINDRFMLVDMPGYGYAKAAEHKVRAWSGLIEHYIQQRQKLKRLCLLIDARHGFKDNDLAFMDMLKSYAVPFVVILTKIDKIKKTELEALQQQVEATLKEFGAAWPKAFLTSAEKHSGIDAVRLFLAQYAL